MSLYGKRWSIGGVPAGMIRPGEFNGTYAVVFEREFASLEQIEAIGWEQPEIRYTGTQGGEPGLPAGCGFEVERITYDSAARSYTVELRTGRQYLGDVAAYQAQVDALTEELAREKRETAQWQAAAAEKDAALADRERALAALRADSTAAAETELQAAYREGVESYG